MSGHCSFHLCNNSSPFPRLLTIEAQDGTFIILSLRRVVPVNSSATAHAWIVGGCVKYCSNGLATFLARLKIPRTEAKIRDLSESIKMARKHLKTFKSSNSQTNSLKPLATTWLVCLKTGTPQSAFLVAEQHENWGDWYPSLRHGLVRVTFPPKKTFHQTSVSGMWGFGGSRCSFLWVSSDYSNLKKHIYIYINMSDRQIL